LASLMGNKNHHLPSLFLVVYIARCTTWRWIKYGRPFIRGNLMAAGSFLWGHLIRCKLVLISNTFSCGRISMGYPAAV
jgi:hypothetical protein